MAQGDVRSPADAYPGPRSAWVPASIWMAGAVVTWLISLALQQIWISGMSLFAALPFAAALAVGAWRLARHRPMPLVVIGVAQGLLWPSVFLTALWIPKPP